MSEHTPLTEAEAEAVDFQMNEHMYGHSVSNSYAGMSCNVQCRTDAIRHAVNGVLAARTSTATADTDPHALSEAEERELRAERRGYLVGKQEAATADTGLREWVRSLPDKIREYADIFEGQQREDIARVAVFVEFALPFALDATAAPTTDTGARDVRDEHPDHCGCFDCSRHRSPR